MTTKSGNFNGILAAEFGVSINKTGESPVVVSNQIRGNVNTQDNLIDIQGISSLRLQNGMLAFAEDTSKYYQYTGGTRNNSTGTMAGGDWSEVTFAQEITRNYNNYVDNAQYIGDTQSGATDQNGSTADYDTIIPIFEQQKITPVNYYRIYDANELGETIRETNITDGNITARRKY